jgi:hypothetical protein
MDSHERARIQMLEIDHRRMNRMIWRKHPVFALRFALASRFTVDHFWIPMGISIGQCMGYGAGTLQGSSRLDSRPWPVPGSIA